MKLNRGTREIETEINDHKTHRKITPRAHRSGICLRRPRSKHRRNLAGTRRPGALECAAPHEAGVLGQIGARAGGEAARAAAGEAVHVRARGSRALEEATGRHAGGAVERLPLGDGVGTITPS